MSWRESCAMRFSLSLHLLLARSRNLDGTKIDIVPFWLMKAWFFFSFQKCLRYLCICLLCLSNTIFVYSSDSYHELEVGTMATFFTKLDFSYRTAFFFVHQKFLSPHTSLTQVRRVAVVVSTSLDTSLSLKALPVARLIAFSASLFLRHIWHDH